MKLFLLKLTSLALAAASSAYASDEPYVLRGSANSDIFAELESTCSQGQREGRRAVRSLFSGNCDDVWSLSDDASRMKNRNFPDRGNWNQKTRNQCARRGVDDEVRSIEKSCLDDSPEQCEDLGDAAAELIVMDNVCSIMYDQASSHGRPNYKKTCREVAYGICEGQISRTIRNWCPDEMPSTSKLRTLQGKCTSQVNRMTGGGGEAEDVAEDVAEDAAE